MESTPAPSAVKIAPRTVSRHPTTPPPHSNPVVRPHAPSSRATTPAAVPPVSLPALPVVPPVPDHPALRR
ncbi:hypothetical protein [Nocardia sp. NRRL S-836]|uniref:hypothetical protein n=1 Tax=Nocardia sp. NRRL S-836 TaxID=1519492 RepID=UPI0012FA6EFB|nr:hypothetical protein [Nocardia sp. NRRL S-836]